MDFQISSIGFSCGEYGRRNMRRENREKLKEGI
jgi:hypothetical protein